MLEKADEERWIKQTGLSHKDKDERGEKPMRLRILDDAPR